MASLESSNDDLTDLTWCRTVASVIFAPDPHTGRFPLDCMACGCQFMRKIDAVQGCGIYSSHVIRLKRTYEIVNYHFDLILPAE